MRRCSSLLWLVTAALALSQPCLADPVAITGGSASLYSDGQLSSFAFTGLNTEIVQDSRNGWGPTAFTAGSPVQFSGTLDPESTHGFQMTVNGTTYDNVVLVGLASFITDSYTALSGESSAGNVDVPLVISGHFDGFTFGNPAGTPLFSFDVALHGVFQAAFLDIGDGMFLNRTFAATAQFTGPVTPSQTPEPTSLLLMGTPVAGMVLRRLRQRTRR